MIRWLCLLSLVFLSACAHPPSAHPPSSLWSGRLGLKIQDTPPQNLQAGFELQGNAEAGELLLLSPLGNALARLRWSPGLAVLERGDERWVDTDPAQLGQKLVRTPLPVAALFDWLSGKATAADGWTPSLDQWTQGRITVHRDWPLPAADLHIRFDPIQPTDPASAPRS